MSLTPKRIAFIDEYFKSNMNGVEAYLKVYPNSSYESARRSSSVLLTNNDIREEINRRLAEKHMSADEVLSRLAEQARSEYSEYFTAKGTVDLDKLLADKKGHLIKGIKPGKFGKEIMFYDGQTALLNIGKQHGLFTDKLTIEKKVSQEIDTILDTLAELLNPDDYETILARLGGSEKSASQAGANQSAETTED